MKKIILVVLISVVMLLVGCADSGIKNNKDNVQTISDFYDNGRNLLWISASGIYSYNASSLMMNIQDWIDANPNKRIISVISYRDSVGWMVIYEKR